MHERLSVTGLEAEVRSSPDLPHEIRKWLTLLQNFLIFVIRLA